MLIKITSSGRVVQAIENPDGSFWVIGRYGTPVFDPVDGSLCGGVSVHGPFPSTDPRFTIHPD